MELRPARPEGGRWPSEERCFRLAEGTAGAKAQWQEGAGQSEH